MAQNFGYRRQRSNCIILCEWVDLILTYTTGYSETRLSPRAWYWYGSDDECNNHKTYSVSYFFHLAFPFFWGWCKWLTVTCTDEHCHFSPRKCHEHWSSQSGRRNLKTLREWWKEKEKGHVEGGIVGFDRIVRALVMDRCCEMGYDWPCDIYSILCLRMIFDLVAILEY